MSSLKSVTQLEHNVPGCIISIRIPSNEIAKLHTDKTIVDINCKHFFAKLCKPAIQPSLTSNVGGSNGPSDPDAIVFEKPPRVTNRYDNIIDQLERKYYCESMVQSNKEAEENSADESNDSEADEGTLDDNEKQDKELAPAKAKSKSKKRKLLCSDDYDMEDPFIDDEELVLEVEASLKTNRTKTKHDGFFVSAGKLEVFSPKKAQKVSNQATAKPSVLTQKKEQPIAASASTADLLAEEIASPKEGEASEKKKRKRRTKKELEEAALAKGAPSATTSNDVSSPPPPANSMPSAVQTQVPTVIAEMSIEDQVGSPGGTAAVAKVRAEKVLPPWTPDAESLQVLAHFKECYEKTGFKLFKSSNIPKSLEEPLHDVDVVVLKSHSAETLHKTSGYYESLHSILGGEIAIGKIRNLLVRLRLKDKSNSVLQGIEEQVTVLIEDLKSAVVPCPEKLQPAFKAAKKAQAQASKTDGENKDAEKEPAEGAEDEEGDRGDDAAAGGSNVLNTTIDSTVSFDPTLNSPTAKEVTGNNSSGTGVAAQGVRYEFVCNWSKAMKARLVAIENALKLWRLQENIYREKLTVHDKKSLPDKDVSFAYLFVLSVMEDTSYASYCSSFLLTFFVPCCMLHLLSFPFGSAPCWWRRTWLTLILSAFATAHFLPRHPVCKARCLTCAESVHCK